MSQFTKILVKFNLMILVASWIQLNETTKLLQGLLPPNLINFTAVNSYINNFIVIYGGTNGSVFFDSTYMIYLNNSTGEEIHTTVHPSNITNSCGIVWEDAFYLYGSLMQNGSSVSNVFWKLNLTTRSWVLINKTMERMRTCSLQMFENNSMLLFGGSYDNILDVTLLNVGTQTFQTVKVNFTSHVYMQVTQWDDSTANVTVPIEMAPTNISNFLYSQFPISTKHNFQISNSKNQTKKLLQMKGKVYSLYFNAQLAQLQITFVCSNDKFENSEFTSSVSLEDLSIFCFYQPDTKNFYMEYKNKAILKNVRIDSNSPNFYSQTWPDFTISQGVFSLLIINQLTNNAFSCILLIIHQTYDVYALHQDVYNSSYPAGLATTTFGVNQCYSGYRGNNCNETICPNSLYLNSADKLRVIEFECSGHGICSNGTCFCDSLWGGQGCSIYLRTSCQGNLLPNFPLANCECTNATLGANDCSVKFCPNDCTQHGTCQNGSCVCNQAYYGADCSIMIIGFSS